MTADILAAAVPESGWPAEFSRIRRSTGARIAAVEVLVDGQRRNQARIRTYFRPDRATHTPFLENECLDPVRACVLGRLPSGVFGRFMRCVEVASQLVNSGGLLPSIDDLPLHREWRWDVSVDCELQVNTLWHRTVTEIPQLLWPFPCWGVNRSHSVASYWRSMGHLGAETNGRFPQAEEHARTRRL